MYVINIEHGIIIFNISLKKFAAVHSSLPYQMYDTHTVLKIKRYLNPSLEISNKYNPVSSKSSFQKNNHRYYSKMPLVLNTKRPPTPILDICIPNRIL